jgi:hypothetical protein
VLLEYAGYVKESSYFGPVPLYIVLGNHDDRYYGSVVIRDHAKDEFNRMFGLSSGTPVMSPFRYDQVQFEEYRAGCYDFDYKGFHFIILDSTADPFSSNDGVSFGGEQLRWLDSKLKNNSKPAILFWHRNPTKEIESVPSPYDPHFDHGKYEYLEVLYPYRDQIRFVFVGHSHRFEKYSWQGIKFRETTSTMCSEAISPVPVYYTVTCHPDNGTVEVNDGDIFNNPYLIDVTKACQAY